MTLKHLLETSPAKDTDNSYGPQKREYGSRKWLGRWWSVPTLLTLVWFVVLWWGERWTFQHALSNCQWHNWENWPAGSNPHHVVLIADPQLVDPHTYPGRPWPLSTLTVQYTDLYLRRSYRYLHGYLQPDTLFFLGDLFDGGREWGTASTSSAEKRYKKYGNKFWMKEYARFVRIFFKNWGNGAGNSLAEPRGRRIISSLPGNHDLGFASGIQSAVKDRFDAYFGPLNRVDVVGNHTFVSLDTVSLSAMDQVDPTTGSSGAGDGTAAMTAHNNIWKPVEDFLGEVKDIKTRAVRRELRSLSNMSGQSHYPPSVQQHQATQPSYLFPTILLTHVPLFRGSDTSCGPLRERGHALTLAAGYQYQNVLTPLISKDIIAKLGAEEVAQVYSGDDHDYCEIEHNEFTGRIKEITVKSMSWAMGVRKPGFLAVSLYNPVDLSKVAWTEAGTEGHQTKVPKDTIQNHLCLLPDQLTIFIRYGQLLVFTTLVLVIHIIISKQDRRRSLYFERPPSEPLLPISASRRSRSHQNSTSTTSQTSALSALSHSSPLSSPENYLRPTAARPSSPLKPAIHGSYGNIPASSRSSSPVKRIHDPYTFHKPDHTHAASESDDWGMPGLIYEASSRTHSSSMIRTKFQQFFNNTGQVACPVLIFYFWLLWNG